jgi:hypothetical protein
MQGYVLERHNVTAEVVRKRETDLQRTYKYVGLHADGFASYLEHPALTTVEWAVTG